MPMRVPSALSSCFRGLLSQAAAAAGELGLGLTSGRGVGSVVHVGTRVLRLTHVLGEGGYSFVYLAKDVNTGREYALKKMLCQSSEQLELAKNEIDVMHLFKGHKNLLRLIDSDSARKGDEGDSRRDTRRESKEERKGRKKGRIVEKHQMKSNM